MLPLFGHEERSARKESEPAPACRLHLRVRLQPPSGHRFQKFTRARRSSDRQPHRTVTTLHSHVEAQKWAALPLRVDDLRDALEQSGRGRKPPAKSLRQGLPGLSLCSQTGEERLPPGHELSEA